MPVLVQTGNPHSARSAGGRGNHALVLLAAFLALAGCAVAHVPTQGERVQARIFETVTIEGLQPRGHEVNALQHGVTLDDVWERRVVIVGCVLSRDTSSFAVYNESRLALAPPGMTNLKLGDYVAITKGPRGLETGPPSNILRRLPAPREEDLVHYRGTSPVVLCQEDQDGVLHARVISFITPIEGMKARLSIRDPLRGLDEKDVRAGRIVVLRCSRGEEVNPLVWYARLPDGMRAENGQLVVATTGRYDIIWSGLFFPPPWTRRQAFEAEAESRWPIQPGTVMRLLDRLPEQELSDRGIPYCRVRQ
ncbi:MAG TPA: hypothetical protein PKZ40_04770 [Anaerolineaceae bacterium]|nr:hypothetical protein [Smithellaceae bacterium]HPK27037.1 hypothetical protein [Anaerolineaceae bacterium]